MHRFNTGLMSHLIQQPLSASQSIANAFVHVLQNMTQDVSIDNTYKNLYRKSSKVAHRHHGPGTKFHAQMVQIRRKKRQRMRPKNARLR